MNRALLIGEAPESLNFLYVQTPPYDAVVIGSLTLGQLLSVPEERILSALAVGIPVYLYTPGLPASPGNAGMAASLSAARQQLKSWGVRFTDGHQRPLITAADARRPGFAPMDNALLTPLARDFLKQNSL